MPFIPQVKVGNTIYDLKDRRVDGLSNAMKYQKMTPTSTIDNYGISSNGASNVNSAYRILKYAVTPGQKVFIITQTPPKTKAAYLFQSNSNVPEVTNPYVIGTPVCEAVNKEVVVPAGASWLMFSVVKATDTISGMYGSDVISNFVSITDYTAPRNDYILEHFLMQKVNYYQIAEGYKLVDDGQCAPNDQYHLVKYRVTPGIEYYIRGYSNGDIIYQLQASPGVSTSSASVIGTPVTQSVEGYITVPSGAYYLIMSIPVYDTVSGIYTFVDKDTLLPEYWNTYMNDVAVPKIRNNILAIGDHGVAFTFITDQHEQMKCGNLINRVCQEVKGDMLVNGGDIINGGTDKAANVDLMRNLMNGIPNQKQFVIRGNHDANSNFSGSAASNEITDSEFYGLCMKPVEKDVVSNGKLYYYVDNANQKVRYIFLDTGAPDDVVIPDEQITWMTARITELTADWTVVIFAHQMYTSINDIDPSGEKIIEALNAIQSGGKIACVISGHTHKDQSYMTDGGYPVIITTALNAWQESTTQGAVLERTWGTTTEFAFDVFFIDTASKSIHLTRIGAGTDRSFTYA